MEFLMGFFPYGAASQAMPYIRRFAAGPPLSIDELRTLGAALNQAARWEDSVRLVSSYMERDDYDEITLLDLELYCPRPFQDLVEPYARESEIPPELLYGLIRTESAFVPEVVSRAGAIGLTQLLPDTARDMAERLSRRGGPQYAVDGEIDLRDPEINIRLGAVYLRYLINYTENPLLALLAYNGGMGRVRRWRAAETNLPVDLFLETVALSETRDYGRRVLGAAAIYGYLYYNMTMESVLADTMGN
jgi:soluble lytic murein transglycosylase